MFKVFILISFCISAIFVSDTLRILPPNSITGTLPIYKSALVAQPTHVVVHEPILAKVGDVIETVPTAVSHQSSTIVHGKAQRLTPLVTPVVRSYKAPALRTFSALIPALTLRPLSNGGPPIAYLQNTQNPIQMCSFSSTEAITSRSYASA
ncbi:uncharacterized protein [Eurosta solidaginis]|uniref:uncharacterized protein n=1 Tax=Eurosta solidaginis TaxID=178769 RepID=UPI0035317AB5